MARLARLELPSFPHLLLQRAHNFGCLAADERDAEVWRAALHQASRDQAVQVHGYGLWAEGFLLLLTPSTAGGLSLLMQSVGRRYGAHFNRRHGRSGGLWDGRFRTTVVEPSAALLDALLMVESEAGWLALAAGRRAVTDSPAAGGLVPPGWSSRAHHLGRTRDAILQEAPAWWGLGNTPFERESQWARRLEAGLAGRVAERLAHAVDKGWVIGGAAFVAELEARTGRRVQPLRRGRPRKSVAATPPPAAVAIWPATAPTEAASSLPPSQATPLPR